ncbi:tRNA (adenosine(37)-N6)-dimethylallyltransferase MiaA [Arthrobacter roseus]|uniref:tRNA (adenosine(37)-N6)-dimethylallyltransferase MiaA n=1 Tax=Arthrobacter roseus TaxID=136274 RepID=UPI0019661100|nr:tRNA dimethylallyltransferase [Arthrobacter roseus]
MDNLPVVAVVGPTGTGKSELALNLAHEIGGEVINADAMQFYRGMDIGTAKLGEREREGVPHHLLDILEIHEEASVSHFQAQSRACMDEVRSRGHYPILVGGSGLYVRAALDILEFPGTDPSIRRELEADMEETGLETMRSRLESVDPESAASLGDARRVIRALEVHALTGRTFTSFMPQREYVQPAVQIGLRAEPAELGPKLSERVYRMERQGLLEEVRRLEPLGLRWGKTASRALGYAQFLRVLDDDMRIEDAVDETAVATRKLARKQRTWFRGDNRIQWLSWQEPGLAELAATIVREYTAGER